MYSLNYTMIVQVLKQYKYTGEAHAVVSAHSPLKQEGRIILSAQNGIVVSCFILNRNNQKLYHDQDALHLLPSFGVLDWQLVRTTTPSNSVASANAGSTQPPAMNGYHSSFLPHKLSVSPFLMDEWSSLQRSVYFLSDGRRTVQQMATLLARPIDQVQQAINELQRAKAIE